MNNVITCDFLAHEWLLFPITMLTHSLSLFDILTKDSPFATKHMKIDLKNLQSFNHKIKIVHVASKPSESRTADILTKREELNLLDMQ